MSRGGAEGARAGARRGDRAGRARVGSLGGWGVRRGVIFPAAPPSGWREHGTGVTMKGGGRRRDSDPTPVPRGGDSSGAPSHVVPPPFPAFRAAPARPVAGGRLGGPPRGRGPGPAARRPR